MAHTTMTANKDQTHVQRAMSGTPRLFFVLSLCLITAPSAVSANARVLLTGEIVDSSNGQPLATANIRAKNTSLATIANEEGAFLIGVSELPVALIITHIGYADQEVLVNEAVAPLSIRMQPIAYPFEEVVITPGMGAGIMRKVIARKRQWRPNLKRFRAMAYTRQVIENIENEARIVGMGDLISEIYWDADLGSREVILSKRHTKNVPEWLHTFSLVKSLHAFPNIYDDEIVFAGNRIIGPTHPDALDYYHFRLREQQYNGKRVIYEISVHPKTKLQPAFTGRVFVLDEAIIRAELSPSPIALSVVPFARTQVSFLQQFQAFGDAMWLPIDFHVDIVGRVAIPCAVRTPTGKVTVTTQLSNFEINEALAAPLYETGQQVSVDEASVQADSSFTKFPDRIPLSAREEKAYREIDETLTLRKAFPPSGPLARWVTMSAGPLKLPTKSPRKGYRPVVDWGLRGEYNRVSMAEGRMRMGVGVINSATGRRHRVFLEGGYAQGPARYLYRVEFWHEWGRMRSGNPGRLSIRHQTEIAERYRSHHYGSRRVSEMLSVNNALSLLGWDDYYDYYWRESTAVEISQSLSRGKVRLTASVRDAKHESLRKQTDFNILGRDIVQRANPPIDEGRLRSVDFRLAFAKSRYKRATVRIEWSSPDLLSSDFSFFKCELGVDWRVETFLKRRANPNVLDVRVVAGTSTGDLPVQRFGVLDVWRPVTAFGTFRHLGDYPYEGEKYLGVYWQHNFRAAPFEIFNLGYLARNGFEIILYGGSGRTWISQEKLNTLHYTPHVLDKFYHEAGIALSWSRILRLDATKRLDERGFSIRASLSN